MKFRNIWLAIKDQGPLKRIWKNLKNGQIKGLFHINSHISQRSGKSKVGYNTKASAVKAADVMGEKHGIIYSNYYCIFCGKYHIGGNRVANKNQEV